MKTIKKILSLVLVLAVVLTCIPVAAFASSKPEFNYVAFGASNTNGFGIKGYIPEEFTTEEYYQDPDAFRMNGNVISGLNKEVPSTYPVIIKEKLSKKYDVNLSQLAQCGMRVEELRLLLDKDYQGDKYTEWRFLNKNGEEPYGWFVDEYEKLDPATLSSLQDMYINAVKNADLITMDLGTNNFGPYLFNRLFSNYYDADFRHIYKPECAEKFYEIRDDLANTLTKIIKDVSKEDLDNINFYIDTLAYALLGFCNNYDRCIELIRKYNKNAEIIVVGIQNLFENVKLDINGVKLSGEAIYGALIRLANKHLMRKSIFRSYYTYVPVSGCDGIENFVATVAAYDGKEIPLVLTECFDVYDNSTFLRTRVNEACTTKDVVDQALADSVYYDSAKTLAKFFSDSVKSNVINIETVTSYRFRISEFTENIIENALAGNLSTDEKINDFVNSSFANDAQLKEYLNYYVRFETGNALMTHPTAAGHQEMAGKIWLGYRLHTLF